jgi:alpha-tubulin suppressor-like RCC1 family protein
MGSRVAVRVAGVAAILAMVGCSDATTQAGSALSITAVSVLYQYQQTIVNQFVPSDPTVRVTDPGGHPVAGASVFFSVEHTSSTSTTTGADGVASFRWRLTPFAGTQTLVASLSAGNSPPGALTVVFTAVAQPDSLWAIHAVSAISQTGVASEVALVSPTILAIDQYANAKPGVEVTFEVPNGIGRVATAKVITDATGQATVAAWTLGANLGTDTLVARAPNVVPVFFTASVVAPFIATTVVAGDEYTCALTSAGDVYCWGANASGQATAGNPSQSVMRPALVPLGTKVVGLSTQYAHTCAISNESPPQAYCWGQNLSGQLGRTGSGSWFVPVRVPVADGLSLVVAGGQHSCGLTPAGVAYCWGDNSYGQRGTGDINACFNPSSGVGGACPGPTPVATDQRFIALAAGPDDTCGLTADGRVYCWGLDDGGQLGFDAPKSCSEYDYGNSYPVSCALTPQRVPVIPSLTAIAIGVQTCGLTGPGGVWCFGTVRGTVSLPNAGPIKRLAPDGRCGIAANAAGYCWDYTFDQRSASLTNPQPIGGVRTFAALSGGFTHRCGLLASNNAVVCWGLNTFGELGNTTRTNSDVPVAVVAP